MEDKSLLPTKRKRSGNPQSHHKSRKTFRASSSIGDLPNSIIEQILQCLPVKDAIMFCSLSRHWLSLWKSMDNLSFHCESFKVKDISRFASFVDKSLKKVCVPSKIKRFSLKICYNRNLRKIAESWIRFATSHKVEELCLNFTRLFDRPFDLGRGLIESICWTSLKILSLTDVNFDCETIRAILLGTPLIESLTLRECVVYDSKIIDASGTSLKELVIDGCRRSSVYRWISISAPRLSSLTVAGYFRHTMQKLVDVSSLKEATINLKTERRGVVSEHEKKMLTGLVEQLSHVNKLTIGIESLQALSMMRLDGEIIPTSRCETLKVEMKLDKSFLPGMEALLTSSPYLKQLIMNVSAHACNRSTICRIKHFVEDNYWSSETRNFSCLNENLRRVEVIGFVPGNPRWSRNQILVETMHFLLDNAKLLQKLIVQGRGGKHKRMLEIKEQILTHPRASPNAQVEFMFP